MKRSRIQIFKSCEEAKCISDRETEQYFCETCQRFLADRYLLGICPDCKFENARADQCDSCGNFPKRVSLNQNVLFVNMSL